MRYKIIILLIEYQHYIENIRPRAVVTETVYRLYNGKLKYRKWNATHSYWIDIDWIYA